MHDLRVPRSRRALPRGPRRVGVYLLYVLLAAFCVFVLVRNLDSPNDYANFVPFGVVALEGLNPYDPAVVAEFGRGGTLWSTWPPAFAPVAALLAQLDAAIGAPAAIALWQAANLLGLVMLLALSTRWLYRRRLGLRPGSRHMPLYAAGALAGLVIPFRLVLSNFEHTQSNLLFLGLAAAGFWLFHERRRWSGGLALGLATAFKATPLLLLPYLGWRGRWRDLGAAVVGCGVAWIVLPGLLVGLSELEAWYAGWLGFVGGMEIPISHWNQSLQGTLTRWFAPGGVAEHVARVGSDAGAVAAGAAGVDPAGAAASGGTPLHVPGGPLGGPGASVVVGALAGLLGLGGAIAFGLPGRRVSRHREALELGVIFTALALFSPIGWKFHFVGLVVLAAALYARIDVVTGSSGAGGTASATGGRSPVAADEERWDEDEAEGDGPGAAGAVGAVGRPWAASDGGVLRRLRDPVWTTLAVAALAINGTATALVGAGTADRLEYYGVITWTAMALVVLALWRLWRERRAAAAG